MKSWITSRGATSVSAPTRGARSPEACEVVLHKPALIAKESRMDVRRLLDEDQQLLGREEVRRITGVRRSCTSRPAL